jgi:hypothetical protein
LIIRLFFEKIVSLVAENFLNYFQIKSLFMAESLVERIHTKFNQSSACLKILKLFNNKKQYITYYF